MDKVFRFGVDRIVIGNINIKNLGSDIIFKNEIKKEEFGKCEDVDKLFTLNYKVDFLKNGQVIQKHTLRFNPNKILFGNNLGNARELEINEAIKILKRILKDKKLEVDFENAQIYELEININMPINIHKNDEVSDTIMAQFSEAKVISKLNKNTFKIIDRQEQETWFSSGNYPIFKIYDKTKQLKDKKIKEKIIRFEFIFNKKTYESRANKLNIDNKLSTLLNNFNLIEKMFINEFYDKVLSKIPNYLNEVEKNIELVYKSFKQNQLLARKTGRKEKRNVYLFLKEFVLFDKELIYPVIKRHNKINFSREVKRTNKLLNHIDGNRKFNRLVELIFSSLNSISEEDLIKIKSLEPYIDKELVNNIQNKERAL